MSDAIEVLKKIKAELQTDSLLTVSPIPEDHAKYVCGLDKAILDLEKKEKLKKKMNGVLEYYECNPYNHRTGFKLGDEAREEVMETLNELLKELEEGVKK